MIESTAQGAIFTRLRDNQFLVSALREIRRRTFGYASAHFLSYFREGVFHGGVLNILRSNAATTRPR
ncbi:MAG: hypothetical protein IPH06_13675 [Alphaproteobacteria bacterium]|nr:hypothetical protein [Alphaproteobacteria bacterium]